MLIFIWIPLYIHCIWDILFSHLEEISNSEEPLISGHDRLHYWPFDVQKVWTSKGGWLPSEELPEVSQIGASMPLNSEVWRAERIFKGISRHHLSQTTRNTGKIWQDLGGLKRLRWRALGAAGGSIEMVFWLWVCIASLALEMGRID